MRILKRILLCLTIFTAVMGTSACMGTDKFTDKQEQEAIAQGRPMLEEFLSSLPIKQLEKVQFVMPTAIEEGSLIWAGRYPTNSAEALFQADGKSYQAIVDLETGNIYSDYYMFDLNKYIKKQLKPYCERYGFSGDFEVENADVWYTFYSHDVLKNGKSDQKTNSYVDLDGMLPVEYNQADEADRAEAFLKNAPLSDFQIKYTMQDAELFDPRILSDYLTESGNYCREFTRQRGLNDYKIYGTRKFDVFPTEATASWKIYLTFIDDYNKMDYYITRSTYRKEGDFCFSYASGIQSGDIDTYTQDQMEEYRFPVEIQDGKMSFYSSAPNEYVTLRFEKEPKYSFTRVCYKDGAASEEEKLIPVRAEDNDNMWYLTLESHPDFYRYSYKFECEQEIYFK